MKQSKYNHALKWSLLGLGGALFLFMAGSYFFGRISEAGIIFDASTDSSSETIGLPFDIHLIANNDSDNLLKDVTVSLLLPDGAIFASGDDQKINSMDIGDIRPGEIKEETFSVIILPMDSPVRVFSATMQYALGKLTATFEKKAAAQVTADDFPLTFDVVAPESVSPGQEFEIRVKYKNIFGKILPGLRIAFDHPEIFKLTSAVPKPDEDGHWNIDGLSAGEEGEINLKGSANLQGDSNFEVAFRAVLNLDGFNYDVLKRPVPIKVEPSPLSINISSDQSAAYRLGDTMRYSLNYRNNSDEAYGNAAIKVKLSGEMHDLSSLSVANATFSSVTRTITWSPNKLPELTSIPPGAGGNLEFSVNVKKTFSIRRINDRNFTVKADARIESTNAVGLSSVELKIAGALLVESAGYFRDAASLILNDGPWPPKVGMPTDLTIHWRIGSYSTDVSNLEVRARLADGVAFTGKTKSSNGVLPEIDTATGEVVWKVGKLLANAGILSDKPEAIFQVRATPTDGMAGNYMKLLEMTSVKATDDFSGLELTSSAEPVTTRLPSDTTVKENEGMVTR